MLPAPDMKETQYEAKIISISQGYKLGCFAVCGCSVPAPFLGRSRAASKYSTFSHGIGVSFYLLDWNGGQSFVISFTYHSGHIVLSAKRCGDLWQAVKGERVTRGRIKKGDLHRRERYCSAPSASAANSLARPSSSSFLSVEKVCGTECGDHA